MAFTYDVTTARGKVRLLIPDTDSASQLFQDDEIDAFLSLASQNVHIGAALALETLIREKGVRLAKRTKLGNYETEEHAISDLKDLAKQLRDAALSGELQQGLIGLSGDVMDGYRPDWLGEDSARELGLE